MAALCYAEARGVRRDDARAVELYCRATQVGVRQRPKRPRRRGSSASASAALPARALLARPVRRRLPVRPLRPPPRTALCARNAEG
jgi:hypothetical protein